MAAKSQNTPCSGFTKTSETQTTNRTEPKRQRGKEAKIIPPSSYYQVISFHITKRKKTKREAPVRSVTTHPTNHPPINPTKTTQFPQQQTNQPKTPTSRLQTKRSKITPKTTPPNRLKHPHWGDFPAREPTSSTNFQLTKPPPWPKQI